MKNLPLALAIASLVNTGCGGLFTSTTLNASQRGAAGQGLAQLVARTQFVPIVQADRLT